jgi:hypothetical protein
VAKQESTLIEEFRRLLRLADWVLEAADGDERTELLQIRESLVSELEEMKERSRPRAVLSALLPISKDGNKNWSIQPSNKA